MIVWLASYPRSGNTLLRTILKRCMGLDSYSDESVLVESPLRSDPGLIGHRELPSAWPEFYEHASKADQVFLVKTHLPPRDEQPYIYVVRDGRSAIRSYRRYFRKYVPHHHASLYQLIVGDDAYGDWSSHHQAWVGRTGPKGMVTRFEDLTEVSADLLAAIARFVRHAGAVAQWRNPFDSLAQVEPEFFREGSKTFMGDDEWPVLADQMFDFFHAALLARLGYAASPISPRCAELEELFRLTRQLVERNRTLAAACDERLRLIERLSEEAQKRLDIINRFASRSAS